MSYRYQFLFYFCFPFPSSHANRLQRLWHSTPVNISNWKNSKLVNSQQIHMSVVKIARLSITAPGTSPNTDGIHIDREEHHLPGADGGAGWRNGWPSYWCCGLRVRAAGPPRSETLGGGGRRPPRRRVGPRWTRGSRTRRPRWPRSSSCSSASSAPTRS